jgi:puromycin-sensitive aminopeptidase
METDGLHATRPVEYPVGRPEEADGMFDVLTYQKGGAVLKMLEQYLGPEVFRKGISHYLSAHSYGNTETSDLWDALEAVSGEPVRSMMHSWISQGGHPVVSADLGEDPATVVLGQRRFLYDGTESAERWSVPVNVRASIEGVIHHERLLLDQAEARCSFPGPVDWVVVNDGSWGFYRTRYSDRLWRRLVDTGALAGLDALERLQLLGDTWAGVTSGSAPLSVWAEAARAVAGEPDPDVWGSLLVSLRLLDLASDAADRSALRTFVADLASPAWAGVGWEPADGESDRVATARGRILTALADFGNDTGVIADARSRFAAHLGGASGEGALAADLVGPAARITVSNGGEAEWEEVLDAYRRTTNPHQQLRYLYALNRTPSQELILRTLAMCLGNEVRSQDAPFLIAAGIGQRRAGRAAWDWLRAHWSEVADHLPPSLYIRVFDALTAIVDPAIAASAHQFFDTTEIRVAPIRLRQVIEGMDVNVALGQRLTGRIAGALSPG